MDNIEEKINELKLKIADAKKRIPYHSIQPYLVHELEDLEEQLENLQKNPTMFLK
jgi:hypothetical protein